MTDDSLTSISYLIGLIVDHNRDREVERLIASIAAQRGIADARVGIGIKANDRRDYASLVRTVLESCENGHLIDVFEAGKKSHDSIGASHNMLANLAIEQGYDRYLSLKPNSLLHHEAIFHLTEKWHTCPDQSIVEMRLFPKEHPKTYDPATGETGWCSGACLSISPHTLKLHGGFDENCGLYFEDVDLSWRLRMAGQKCFLAPNSLCFYDITEDSDTYSTRLEMLKSGRYLGQKWKHHDFQMTMEEQLTKLWGHKIEGMKPENTRVKVDYSDEELAAICNFEHGFNFSVTRW